MISFERLRALHAVSKHGSVVAAAAALHVTNSAVSQQIAKLEAELGEPLLKKSGRGVKLTDSAALLVAHADQLFAMLERAEAEFDARRDAIVGQISVATFATALRGLAPLALQYLEKNHPQLEVIVHEQEPAAAISLLDRGDIDLVIATDWKNAPLPTFTGLTKATLMDDIADIAMPMRHRLAKQHEVRLKDLASDSWISWHNGSICHDWLVQALRACGHEPTFSHRANEHASQLALVAAGLGVCVIPRLGRDPVPRQLRIVPVKPALVRHVYALWREESTRRRAIGVALEAFKVASKKVPL
jgi:DNA-binding transcriptional LysR family regulator